MAIVAELKKFATKKRFAHQIKLTIALDKIKVLVVLFKNGKLRKNFKT